MPTGLLCVLFAVFTLAAIACGAALYLLGFRWDAAAFGAFMTLMAASVGRALYEQGKDL